MKGSEKRRTPSVLLFKENLNASRPCFLHIKKCSVLCSVPSNIRIGPTDSKKGTYLKKNLNASRLCFLHIEKRSVLCSVPSNIRTGPTDDAKKGTYYEKSKRNKGKKKAPESYTSQATCWTKEIKRPSLPLDTRGQSK